MDLPDWKDCQPGTLSWTLLQGSYLSLNAFMIPLTSIICSNNLNVRSYVDYT